MNNIEDKKINNIISIISGIIIVIIVLFGVILIDFFKINIILPRSARFLIRPIMIGISVFLVTVLSERVKKILKKSKKFQQK